MFKQDSVSPFNGKLMNKMKRYQKKPPKSLAIPNSIPFLPPLLPESPFTPPLQSVLEFTLPFSILVRSNSSASTPDELSTSRFRSSSTPSPRKPTPRSRSHTMSKSATPSGSSIFLSNTRSITHTPPRPPLFSSPLSLSSMPVTYSSPLSMTSGPRSVKGPKVKAYMYTQSYQSPTSHLLLTKCSVCDEHLSQRLQNEVLVVFRDKLLMHAQCMQVMVTYNLELAIEEGNLTNGLSEKDWISTGFKNMSIPSDREVIEEVISTVQAQFACKLDKINEKSQSINFMRLANTLERTSLKSTKQNTPITPTPIPGSFFVSEGNSAFDDWNTLKDNEEQPTQSTTGPPALLAPEKTTGLGIFAATDLAQKHETFRCDERLARISLRNLTVSTMHSSVRSLSPDPSIMTVQTISANIECHRNIAPEKLKTGFINVLLQSSSQVTLAHLVKLGELRIVDNLRVCLNRSPDVTRTVYLFEHYLVVSPKNDKSEMIQFKLLECKLSTFGSLLKLTCGIREIKLCSENRIIEKWVVAVCDRTIIFPVEFISSSIALSPYQTHESTDSSFSAPLLKDRWSSSETPDSATTIKALPFSLDDTAEDHISLANSSSSTNMHINMDSDLIPDTNSDMNLDSNSDSDSDSDSDAELIEDALRSCPTDQQNIKRPVFVAEARTTENVHVPEAEQPGWDDLVAQLDYALIHQ